MIRTLDYTINQYRIDRWPIGGSLSPNASKWTIGLYPSSFGSSPSAPWIFPKWTSYTATWTDPKPVPRSWPKKSHKVKRKNMASMSRKEMPKSPAPTYPVEQVVKRKNAR